MYKITNVFALWGALLIGGIAYSIGSAGSNVHGVALCAAALSGAASIAVCSAFAMAGSRRLAEIIFGSLGIVIGLYPLSMPLVSMALVSVMALGALVAGQRMFSSVAVFCALVGAILPCKLLTLEEGRDAVTAFTVFALFFGIAYLFSMLANQKKGNGWERYYDNTRERLY